MIAETNLNTLLKSMSPVLLEEEYVFVSFKEARYGDYSELEPIASFMEAEGLTLVVPRTKADDHALKYEATFSAITLQVHSSLEAVGLTAAFSKKLTEHGISANVIAGYHHDHIFVQSDRASQAMTALGEFAG